MSNSATPCIAACQASLFITNSRSLLKLMSIKSVMPSSHLILCHPLLLPPIPPSIRVFPNESALCMRWPEYWSRTIQMHTFALFCLFLSAYWSWDSSTRLHIYPEIISLSWCVVVPWMAILQFLSFFILSTVYGQLDNWVTFSFYLLQRRLTWTFFFNTEI